MKSISDILLKKWNGQEELTEDEIQHFVSRTAEGQVKSGQLGMDVIVLSRIPKQIGPC